MKIRSYKGPSLDTLYAAIRKELGPDAIVISARGGSEKRSLFGSLLGNEPHELIAVVDDVAADRHALGGLGAGALSDFSSRQAKQWQSMEATLTQLRGEIRGLAAAPALGPADEWDPRFVKSLRAAGVDRVDPALTPERLRDGLAAVLRVEERFVPAQKSRPHVIVFVGPTGSGKTTTLAKLAARWCLTDKLKLGLVTTDTFRVAAVDQIREYATLLGLELGVAFSAQEAAAAVKRYADRDVILVDTPGRNHFDQIGLAGIRGVLQGLGPVTVMLHVPAVLDRRHVAEMVSNFQVLKPNYIVVTKADETRRYGMMTTLACDSDCPIAFITDGQRVPQDIHPAAARDVASMILGEVA